jgi:hypothetical protein
MGTGSSKRVIEEWETYNLRIQGVKCDEDAIDRCVNGKILLKRTLQMGLENVDDIFI